MIQLYSKAFGWPLLVFGLWLGPLLPSLGPALQGTTLRSLLCAQLREHLALPKLAVFSSAQRHHAG